MTTRSSRLYVVYDGRAVYDVDQATVLFTTHNLDAAIKMLDNFADAVLYSYAMTDSGYLTDARVENVQHKDEAAS